MAYICPYSIYIYAGVNMCLMFCGIDRCVSLGRAGARDKRTCQTFKARGIVKSQYLENLTEFCVSNFIYGINGQTP